MQSEPDFANPFKALLWMLGPLTAGIVATFVALPLSWNVPDHATREFYSAAADVGVILLVALAIEARLFRLGRIPRVKLTNPSRRWTDARARKIWTAFYVTQVLVIAGVILAAERSILLTLARGDYARASARGVFGGLVFGLVTVVVTGLILPTAQD